MKKRSLLFTSLALAIVLAVGGVMAWFTSEAEVLNKFEAGKLDIDTRIDNKGTDLDNVNPGDEFSPDYFVKNNGSKRVYLRVKFEPKWEDGLVEGWGPAGIEMHNNTWVLNDDGYYYFQGVLEPGKEISFMLYTRFEGEGMGNEFQGAGFEVDAKIEAIQVTNGAVETEWPNSGLKSIE